MTDDDRVAVEYIGAVETPFEVRANGFAFTVEPAYERVYKLPAPAADYLLEHRSEEWREWNGTPYKVTNIEPDAV